MFALTAVISATQAQDIKSASSSPKKNTPKLKKKR